MKKNFKYMIFASFLFLFSVVGVKAANDYYVCEYKAKDTSGNYMEKYGITSQNEILQDIQELESSHYHIK